MTIKMTCPECGSATEEELYNGKIGGLQVTDIKALKCTGCGEVYITPEGNREIDRQMAEVL